MRRFVAILLAVVMMCSFSQMTFGETQTYAEKLYNLGLLTDISQKDLEAELTREIGLTMILKALGYTQADADAVSSTSKFKDTEGWFKGWAALAYNLNITVGVSETSFAPSQPLTERQFVAFLLRALGYDTNESYNKAVELGQSLGLISKGNNLTSTTYNKGQAAEVMFKSLSTKMKNEEETLADKLISKKLFTNEQAEKLGIKVSKSKVTKVSVNTLKEVTVFFSKPVDDTKIVCTIMNNNTPIGNKQEWNADKTVAKLITGGIMLDGNYYVEISGLSEGIIKENFVVDSSKVMKIELLDNTVELKNGSQLNFMVSNPYGQIVPVDGSKVIASVYNTTQGKSEQVADVVEVNGSVLQLSSLKTDGAKVGDNLKITITYGDSMCQAECKVVDVQGPSSIKFGPVTPLANKARINIWDSGLVLPYTLTDSNGEYIKFKPHGANADNTEDVETIGDVIFTSSKSLVVDVDSFKVDSNGVLMFSAGPIEGEAIITAYMKSTGVSVKIPINTYSQSRVEDIKVAEPTQVIAAGEKIELPIIALDQYGTLMDPTQIFGLAFTSSNYQVVANSSAYLVSGKLNITTSGEGRTEISIFNSLGKLLAKTAIVVEAPAKPVLISKVNFPTVFEADTLAIKKLTYNDLVVYDQYGRIFNLKDSDIKVNIALKDGSTDVMSIGSATFGSLGVDIAPNGTVGTGTYKIWLDGMEGSAVEVDFTTVKSSDIKKFELPEVPLMYIGASHKQEITMVGKLENGTEVVLSYDKITNITSSNPNVVKVSNAGNTITLTGSDEGTSTIIVWNEANKLAEFNVTVSKKTPEIESLSIKDNAKLELKVDESIDLNTLVKAVDQYGFETSFKGTWSVDNTNIAKYENGKLKGVSQGTVNVTGVTSNGKTITISITVK